VLLFYAVARFLDSWAKVRVFLVAGVTSAVVISVYGIIQHFGLDPVPGWGIPWYEGSRAFSTLGWALWLAAYLTLMIGGTLALYFYTNARWERALWLVALAVMTTAWLYTYSRGPVLGVVVALPVVLWLAHRGLGSVRPLLAPLLVIAAVVVSAHLASIAFSPYSTTALGRFDSANVAMSPDEKPEGGDASIATRLLMWRDTIPVIAERPILGHGPDNFAKPFDRHEGEDLRAFFGDRVVDKAHNELLQVAATTGLLGLAAYLWIFVSYFRHAYKSGGWPLLALSGGMLAYILQLQTAFTTIATGVTFWAILGVSVAIMRLQQTSGEIPQE
jgi:putative inorganic carbon (HCO3(-)) transporter